MQQASHPGARDDSGLDKCGYGVCPPESVPAGKNLCMCPCPMDICGYERPVISNSRPPTPNPSLRAVGHHRTWRRWRPRRHPAEATRRVQGWWPWARGRRRRHCLRDEWMRRAPKMLPHAIGSPLTSGRGRPRMEVVEALRDEGRRWSRCAASPPPSSVDVLCAL